MPKTSARFRNRKINFRTRIAIRTGAVDLPSDPEDDELGFDDDRRASLAGAGNERAHLVDTGVDKEEESELHLQKVINASAASLLRSAVNPDRGPQTPGVVGDTVQAAADSASATLSATANPNVPHIPTPDATGLVDPAIYEALYAHSKIFLPSSYIRFSDTVEDTLGGVVYTMDEDDEAWLKQFNFSQDQSLGQASNPGSALRNLSVTASDDPAAKNRKSSGRKGKEKERPVADPEGPGRLAEDDFEALMDHFEKTTEETVPGLHLDTNRLPSLADFENTFESRLSNPRLLSIKIFAKFVYSHWKERRLKRGGKPIMPAIDFDESNENNPYVCFRRREIKMVRKTRRTDAQNMDRLVRLRNDLYKAQELLNTVLSRERVKREAVELEKVIFRGRCLIRDMKRSVGEPDGDEDLLVSKKEKRRKREESGTGTLKSPLRKPNGLSGPGGPIASIPETEVQEVQMLQEQARSQARMMERELNRRREEQAGWEDLTDSCHQPMLLSAAAVRWRGAVLNESSASAPTSKGAKQITTTLEQGPPNAPSVMHNNHFRKRVGRGGRLMLDRIVASRQRTWPDPLTRLGTVPNKDFEEDARLRRVADRWRYDDDLRTDFPHIDDPPIIDDYCIPFSSRRRNMLDIDDIDCLDSHSDVYLNRVLEYLGRVPEPEPPVVKIGKLPVKVVPNLFGMNINRAHLPLGSSPTTLQEQIMSAQATTNAQGFGSHHAAKRFLSGVVGRDLMNSIHSSQANNGARGRRTPNNVALPNNLNNAPVQIASNGPPSHQQLHHLSNLAGWPMSNQNSTGASIATPTTNPVSTPHSLHSNPNATSPYPVNMAHIGGLSRSIPVPANNTPMGRNMNNGFNVANHMAPPLSISRPCSTDSPAAQHQASPYVSRPGSAAANPIINQIPSRHPTPHVSSPKMSPGQRSATVLSQQPQPNPVTGQPLASPLSTPSSRITNGGAQTTPHQTQGIGSVSPISNGKTSSKTSGLAHSQHSPLHLIQANPTSHASGIFNPLFAHPTSPAQSGQNGATAASTTSFS